MRRSERTRAGGFWESRSVFPYWNALKAVTRYAAMQYFEEDSKGSITPGKQANFVLLSGDPLSLPRDDLPFLTVLATILQDHVIYRRPGSAVVNALILFPPRNLLFSPENFPLPLPFLPCSGVK